MLKHRGHQAEAFLETCAKTAFQVHIVPSVTNEIHSALKNDLERNILESLSERARTIFMSSPFGPKMVLGVTPNLKEGGKVALVEGTGRFVSNTVLQVTGEGAEEKAKKLLGEVFKQIQIGGVAVGHGADGRKTEIFLRKILKELAYDIPVVLMNSSSARAYSTSEEACKEFPELDPKVRSAISLARQLQDPLAELVKYDPKTLQLGQSQNNVEPTQIEKALRKVIEFCVHQVGVNLIRLRSFYFSMFQGSSLTLPRVLLIFARRMESLRRGESFLRSPGCLHRFLNSRRVFFEYLRARCF